MNYRKYRDAANAIFVIPFLISLIAAGTYCVLTYFDFIEAPFEWEYLAALGGVVAVGAFLAFWLFCISCSVKKKDERRKDQPEKEEQVMDACAEVAVEPERMYIQQPAYIPNRGKTHLQFAFEGKENTETVNVDPKALKKAAMIAIPTAAVTAGVVLALGAKARKKKKIKMILRDLERALGYRK